MITKLKEMIVDATKRKDVIERNILKLLLGEIQNLEATKNRSVETKEINDIIRKFIKNNNETINLSMGSVEDLQTENEILNKLLPETFTQAQLFKVITSNPQLLTNILELKNIGQAIGMAKKEISQYYTQEILGSDLKVVIEGIRNVSPAT